MPIGPARRRLVVREEIAMTRATASHAAASDPVPAGPPRVSGPDLDALVDGWVNARIITPTQARLIKASGAAAPPRPHPHTSMVVEALAYVGGVIVTAGCFLIAAQYWHDLGTTSRLLILGAVVCVLLAGGFAVPKRLGDAASRLRSVVWLAGCAAVAGFLGVLATKTFDLDDADVGVLVATGTAAVAAVLWTQHRVFVQQLVMMVALLLATASAIGDFVQGDALPGVGVWAVAACWLLLGWGGLLRPRRAVVPVAAAGMVFGAMSTSSYDAGIAFALVNATAVVVAAVALRDLILLAVGALGTLMILPRAANEWFPGRLAAPLTLVVVGCGLVAAAVWIAVRRPSGATETAGRRDWSEGTPRRALTAAATVAGVAALFVLVAAIA